ncbi:Negative regulator of systemic acquired resistance (SNI1), partial [Thalictrum thalictroides]
KLFSAIFHILKDNTSLELIMTSYQLLIELDKHFPRMKFSQSNSEPSSSKTTELLVVEEDWSPFSLGPVSCYNEREASHKNSGILLDSSDFFQLTQKIAQRFDEVNCQVPGLKLVGDMMLFQYLVNVLEQDFVSRNTGYKETESWSLIRESFLNMLLGSRSINYKGVMKDWVSILSKEFYHPNGVIINNLENAKQSSGDTVQHYDVALGISYLEMKKKTYMAMQKFFSLIMELDIIKKQADTQGQTSRADGGRTPLLEIILDELTCDEDLFSQFLQVFSDPKWKLEMIVQYFSKYLTKPSVRTRRSSNSTEVETLDDILSCFASDTNTRSIIKKTGTDVAQLLLAHAFQAHLKLEHHNEHRADSSKDTEGSSFVQICRNVISGFQNLRRVDKHMEILPIGKEALFTAATIISMKS